MAAAQGEVLLLFLLLGGSLLAGWVGGWLFRRYRISDIVFLLGVGVLAGPVFGLVDARPFAPAFAILAPLGLAIVLFEGGLELAWRDLRRHGTAALATSLAVWGLTVAALALAAWLVLGLPPVLALLFSLCVSATGILAVIPLLAELKAPPAARVILTVETSLGDLLSAVAVAALAGILVFGASPWEGAAMLGVDFLVGGSVGILAGLLAARALHAIDGGKHGYGVMLALILLAYAFAERIGGSGFLAALTLGLFVGNARELMIAGGLQRLAPPATNMRLHQSEIIFLLRSVYFVFLGLVLDPAVLTPAFALAAVALTAALVGARALAVGLTTPRAPPSERALIVAMMPRGLAAAILAGLPAAMGVPGTESFVAYAFLVIVGADVATTVGLKLQGRRAEAAAPAETTPRVAPD